MEISYIISWDYSFPAVVPKFKIGDTVYDSCRNIYQVQSIHLDATTTYYDIGAVLVEEADLYTLEEVIEIIAVAKGNRHRDKEESLDNVVTIAAPRRGTFYPDAVEEDDFVRTKRKLQAKLEKFASLASVPAPRRSTFYPDAVVETDYETIKRRLQEKLARLNSL